MTLAAIPGLPWQPVPTSPRCLGLPLPGTAPGNSLCSYLLFAATQMEKPATQKEPTTSHTVKLRGAPFNVTEVCASNWDEDTEPLGQQDEGGVL